MALEAIVADWNGTLISERNETPILKHIAVDVARSLIPFHPLKLAKLLSAERELTKLYREGRQDEEFDFVSAMYQVYNQKIIDGTPMSVVRKSVERYAKKPEVQEKLDFRILRLLRKYHDENRICGVLSAGYVYGIDRILAISGYRDSFDFLFADTMVENGGKASRLLLKIYKHKTLLLKKLLEEKKIDAAKTAYIGDTEDDEGCFKLVKYPVVSFFAPDDFKVRCAQKYCAFIPNGEKELQAFFKKVSKSS